MPVAPVAPVGPVAPVAPVGPVGPETPTALIVIDPAAFAIEIPVPGVSVLLTKPEPVPISICPTLGVELKPVPPLATERTPVTPVVKGNPVTLVRTPEIGVPSAGVTKVGLVKVKPLTEVTVAPRSKDVEPSVMPVEKLASSFASCVVPTSDPKV